MRRGSTTAYVERGLAIFAVLWQVGWALTAIAPRVVGTGSSVLVGMLVLTSVTATGLAATIWGPSAWHRRRPVAIVADVAMLGVAAVVYSFVVPEPDAWPLGTIAAVRACVVATLLLRPVPGGIAAAVIATGTGVIGVVGPSRIGTVDALLETLYPVALAIGAAVLAHGLRRSGSRLDLAHLALEAEETERLARAEAARAMADHERRIHNLVLNTLAAISRGGITDIAVTRRRCGDAARSLQALVGQTADLEADAWAEVSAALDALPDHWLVDAVDLATVLRDCPPRVAAAIGSATAEAVRNAGRHSGGTRVRVAADHTGRTWRVVVDDDGAGFAPGARPGLGMERAMTDLIAERGGTVDWTGSPWGGTRVEITWQSPRAREASAAVRSVEADTMQVLPQIGPPFLVPFLGYGLVVVLAGWSSYEQPLWALGWLCLAVAVAPFVGGVPAWASRLGLTGGPTWSRRVVLGIALGMATTQPILSMEGWAVGTAEAPVWLSWASAVALSLVFVVILLGPWWTVFPVLAMWAYAQGSPLELIRPGGVMLVVAALFAASMRRRARDYAVARQAVIAERALADADAIDRFRREQRFAPLVQSAGGLLTALSTGAIDLQDPQTRAACLREERAARSLVRVDRDAGEVEALVSDVVVQARELGRFVDAEIVGDPVSLHAAPFTSGDLSRVRAGLGQTLIASVPDGGSARLTCGWEDDRVVVRLVAHDGDEDSLWEWVIGDD